MNIDNLAPIWQSYYQRRRRCRWICLALAALVLFLAAITMIYGNTIYTLKEVVAALTDTTGSAKGSFTIRTLRWPRMLVGLLTGLAFGMAGNTFQKLLRNSLASPDIIGVTSGASAAAVFGILILGWSGMPVSIMAVVAGTLVATLIYAVSSGKGFSNGRLILVGIGVQAFWNALISWMLLKASEYDVANALRWLSGSLNGVKIESVPLLAAVVLLAGAGIFLLDRRLQIMQLGEEFSKTLGTHPGSVRIALILLALFLTAFSTSVTGPIASVAFLSGPIADHLTGRGQSSMAASALVGAALVLGSDLIGQYAFASRYPVGVITGILGAPYLLYLLLNMNRKR